ncbi:MAG: transglutaminase-like domain-containing protein, partial [Syntrophales bacterium]|nr:transglutaminase-like domain-containing protein [Syntrophales bacterium]
DEKHAWAAARLIGKWVHENLRKIPSFDVPIATEVLKHRRGDCNEHTSLFVALARAAGIPADMSAGLVYMDGAFYYHAWPRVFVGTWVHMDPTFGQAVADATHFELVSGDFSAQAGIVMAMGRTGIEIIDFEF